jgi:hypothetical protein
LCFVLFADRRRLRLVIARTGLPLHAAQYRTDIEPKWSGLPDVKQHEALVHTVGTKRYPSCGSTRNDTRPHR